MYRNEARALGRHMGIVRGNRMLGLTVGDVGDHGSAQVAGSQTTWAETKVALCDEETLTRLLDTEKRDFRQVTFPAGLHSRSGLDTAIVMPHF